MNQKIYSQIYEQINDVHFGEYITYTSLDTQVEDRIERARIAEAEKPLEDKQLADW